MLGEDVCALTFSGSVLNPSSISTQGIEELQTKGLVKAIGVSNFSITKTERLLQTAKIVPALNSVECHPYFQQPKLKKYCESKGIVVWSHFIITIGVHRTHTLHETSTG